MLAKLPARSELIAVSAQALKQVWDKNDLCLPDDRQRTHVEAVSDILQANLSNGRAQRVVGSDTPEITGTCLQRYGLRVATYYWVERERVTGLAAGDERLWEELRQQFERRAYHMLCTYTEMPPAAAFEQAHDHAQEACQKILRGR